MNTTNSLVFSSVLCVLWGCNPASTEVPTFSDGIDYKIESLSFSSSEGTTLLANTNISGSAIIKNIGIENGSVVTSVDIVLSEDNVFSPTDDVLITIPLPAVLSDESIVINFDVTVPIPSSDGYLYWGAIIDPENELGDTDIENNKLISRFYVSNSNQISTDIGISSVNWTVSDDAIISPGTIITPEISLENFGNAVTGQVNYTLYLSDDVNITDSDTVIASGITSFLEPSEIRVLSNSFVTPFTAADGYYYVGIILEETANIYSDSDLTNNITFRRFYFLNPADQSLRPDLSISNITWSEILDATVISGTDISGSMTVTNNGTIASNASWFGIYTSSDDQITGLDSFETYCYFPISCLTFPWFSTYFQ